MIAIDSNVWIYYCDSTTPEHERVREMVRSALERGRVLVNAVVPLEVTHYLTKRRKPDGQSRFEEACLRTENVVVEALGERDVVSRAGSSTNTTPPESAGGTRRSSRRWKPGTSRNSGPTTVGSNVSVTLSTG